jgi:hypothetical protein
VELLKVLVGPLLSATAIAFSYYSFVFNKRRKGLDLDAVPSRLIAAGVEPGHDDKLAITYDGKTLTDPYTIDILLANVGQKDITSKDFDADKPLVINMGAEIRAPMRAPAAERGVPLDPDVIGGTIVIKPRLFSIREAHVARILVNGTPTISLSEKVLIDTDIHTDATLEREVISTMNRLKRFMTYGLIVCLISFALLGRAATKAHLLVWDHDHIWAYFRYFHEGKVNLWSAFGPTWVLLWFWTTIATALALIAGFAWAYFYYHFREPSERIYKRLLTRLATENEDG